MRAIIPKLLGRNPRKAISYVRDLAIPIALLLSVGALVGTLGNEVTDLLLLTNQSSYLTIQEANATSFGMSVVPPEVLDLLNHPNVASFAPVTYLEPILKVEDEAGAETGGGRTVSAAVVERANLAAGFWKGVVVDNEQVSEASTTAVWLGELLVARLGLTNLELPQNVTLEEVGGEEQVFTVVGVTGGSSIFSSSLLMLREGAVGQGLVQPDQPYSIVYAQLRSQAKTSTTLAELEERFATLEPKTSLVINTGTGTNLLLETVLQTVLDQILMFYLVLMTLAVVRLYQAVHWVTTEYRYETNLLRIIGYSRREVVELVVGLGLALGNLALVTGVVGGLLLPQMVLLVLGLATSRPVELSAVTPVEVVAVVLGSNLLFVLGSLVPAFQVANSKVLTPRTREAVNK